MGRGLSEPQKDVIRRIGDELSDRRERAERPDADESARRAAERGVHRRTSNETPSGSASRARTVRRLHARGLIDHIVWHGRWDGRGRTPAGWEVYWHLTGRTPPGMSDGVDD
jgi:hypothetical protein